MSDLDSLIHLLAKLPGLGPRSARRAALYLIKRFLAISGDPDDAIAHPFPRPLHQVLHQPGQAQQLVRLRLIQQGGRFRDATAGSGLDLAGEDSFRVGVDMGTGIGGFIEMTNGAISYATKGRLNPLYAPMIIPNMAAASVAMAFHLRGPNTTVTTACAASTHTLGDASRIIQHGDADVMLAGGSEASLCEGGISSFNAIRAPFYHEYPEVVTMLLREVTYGIVEPYDTLCYETAASGLGGVSLLP